MEYLNINIMFYLSAYLVGSIPFGLILAKLFAKVNIQQSGSQSIGATNVLRVVKEKDPRLAQKLGIATILFDGTKGMGIITVAYMFDLSLETVWAVGVLSVLGHCYSIYLVFEGGKGVATALGVFLILLPIPTLIGVVVWVASAKLFKISSISSLAALAGIMLSAIVLNDGLGINSNAPLYIIIFIIFYKHIPNIIRVFQGKEKKI
ncbi:MAG: acyl-phosphate--glycerol-3-phosphate O-acyltransferase [Epsilonproteobacteria bacterium]|nr:MAG: acyl-phosphate--glycerol-3-phosphate O-acyltransferase [Campylobacterota bacterium]